MCLGVPGQIVELREVDGLRMGTVDFGGTRREVCLAYVPEAGLGDYVVVHVGFAISVVSESEARETQALLEEIAAQELPASSKLAGS